MIADTFACCASSGAGAPDPDAAVVAALKAVDDALTSETPPAALRNSDVVLIAVCELDASGQPDMGPGTRRRMLVEADPGGVLRPAAGGRRRPSSPARGGGEAGMSALDRPEWHRRPSSTARTGAKQG